MAKTRRKKSTTTVNVGAVKKDIQKMAKESVKNTAPSSSHGELSPGTVRRESPLEQEMGPGKYKEMIHSHNSKNSHILDRLPFTFPKKKTVRSHLNIVVACSDCGHQISGSENTVGFTCPVCHKYVSAINPEAETRGFDPELNVGFRGTASDRLRLKEKRKKG